MAGLASSLIYICYPGGLMRCRDCKGFMLLAGTHFSPDGTHKPHWSEIIMIAVHVGVNIAIWLWLPQLLSLSRY
jgi:hypothetical protein